MTPLGNVIDNASVSSMSLNLARSVIVARAETEIGS